MSVTADATLQLTRQVLLPPQVHGPLVGVLVVSIVVDILGRRVGGSAGRRVGGSAGRRIGGAVAEATAAGFERCDRTRAAEEHGVTDLHSRTHRERETG
ncbi:MAG: hypothetical protein HYR62_07985 [Actinobacteria bacterium]|nr:hypothetical protein [Actinomycetota bacterium]